MNSIAILVLTIFFQNGDATARVVIAPNMETCQGARDAIAQQVFEGYQKSGMDIAGETHTVTYVDGYCYLAKEGKRA